MTRFLSFLFALALTTLSFAGAAVTAVPGTLRFELGEPRGERLQLTLQSEDRGRQHSSMTVNPGDLAGLDRAALLGSAGTPVRFALVREAGRLDCSGSSNGAGASGSCRFAGDPSFAAFLAAAGIARPSEEDLLAMTMVGTRRSLVQALQQARYDMPTPGSLVALTAVGVSADYLRQMAAQGYRPDKAADLIPLKALDVSPDFIRSLASVGYRGLSADDLVQLKALDVSAPFIADLQRRGYRDLSVSRLVQLKALGVDPDTLVDRNSRPARRPPLSGADK